MAGYNRWIRYASRKYGIPPEVIEGLIQVESGGDEDAISPAGAFGLTQFMPGTAKSYGVKRGNARSQIIGAAHYLSDLGYSKNPKRALSSYNAGPGNPSAAGDYADKVLAAAGKSSKTIKPIEPVGASTPQTQAAQGPSLFATLGALSAATDPNSLSAQNYQFLDALQTLSGPEPMMQDSGAGVINEGTPTLTGSIQDLVRVAPEADRAGARTKKATMKFVASVAEIYGEPLTIGTGTRHRQMTVNGRQSQHWTGDAADIPATGQALIRMGQAALIAAGMDPKKARRQRGGLYNVNGRQIIFNTHQGGDHTNHLHVGI